LAAFEMFPWLGVEAAFLGSGGVAAAGVFVAGTATSTPATGQPSRAASSAALRERMTTPKFDRTHTFFELLSYCLDRSPFVRGLP
jgi:hypothetical protein